MYELLQSLSKNWKVRFRKFSTLYKYLLADDIQANN